MPETDKESTKPEAPAKSAPVPPVEKSDVFEERTKNALGGSPTAPKMFRKITRTKKPEIKRDHSPLFDGPPSSVLKNRKLIDDAREPLRALRNALAVHLEPAIDLVQEIKDSPEARKVAEAEGFDLSSASKFLNTLAKAEAK